MSSFRSHQIGGSHPTLSHYQVMSVPAIMTDCSGQCVIVSGEMRTNFAHLTHLKIQGLDLSTTHCVNGKASFLLFLGRIMVMADESLTKQICPVTQNIQVMRQLFLSL